MNANQVFAWIKQHREGTLRVQGEVGTDAIGGARGGVGSGLCYRLATCSDPAGRGGVESPRGWGGHHDEAFRHAGSPAETRGAEDRRFPRSAGAGGGAAMADALMGPSINTRVWAAAGVTDMWCGFDTLAA